VAQTLRVLADSDSRPDLHARPPVDDFGFDVAYTERLLPLALWIYRNYFRVETFGIENVPATGRCLLVSNHAGVVPYDGAMIRTAILAEHRRPRHARMLVVDWAFAVPFLSMFLMKTGNAMAHPDNATQLLERNELVGVFPEGVRGATKQFSERYRVRRFGRGGFIQVALRIARTWGHDDARCRCRNDRGGGDNWGRNDGGGRYGTRGGDHNVGSHRWRRQERRENNRVCEAHV